MEGTNLAVHISRLAAAQHRAVLLALLEDGDDALLLYLVSLGALEDGLIRGVADGPARHQLHERFRELGGD